MVNQRKEYILSRC